MDPWWRVRAFDRELIERTVEMLRSDDRAGVRGLVARLRDRGIPTEDILEGLLAPAMSDVGRRWESDMWPASVEHVATGACEVVLTLLTADIEPHGGPGHVFVGCADGELHSLPARFVAEVLRLRDWEVTFVGASICPAEFEKHLEALAPDAVLLSCTMHGNLPGARLLIEAARSVSIPVIVGGAAFDERRARVLGAHAYVASGHEAADILRTIPDGGSGVEPLGTPAAAEHQRMEFRMGAVQARSWDTLIHELPIEGIDWRRVELLLDAIEWLLRTVSAALLVDEPDLVRSHVAWLEGVLRSRGEGPATLHTIIDAVARALDEHPLAQRAVEGARPRREPGQRAG